MEMKPAYISYLSACVGGRISRNKPGRLCTELIHPRGGAALGITVQRDSKYMSSRIGGGAFSPIISIVLMKWSDCVVILFEASTPMLLE